jgi:hypothetical protein
MMPVVYLFFEKFSRRCRRGGINFLTLNPPAGRSTASAEGPDGMDFPGRGSFGQGSASTWREALAASIGMRSAYVFARFFFAQQCGLAQAFRAVPATQRSAADGYTLN